MEHFQVSCESCEQRWTFASAFSLYEQQALESRPCPHCGAYTLRCHEPKGARPPEKTARKRHLTTAP